MLSETFFGLAAYAQHAIRRALGPKASDGPSSAFSGIVNVEITSQVTVPPQELDLLLPKVCEALVLITQCIVTIALDAEEKIDDSRSMRVDNQFKTFFNDTRSDGGDGLIESLLGLPIHSIV
jgi:ataxin-10